MHTHGGVVRLLQVRAPLQHIPWKGYFCKGSDRWTPDVVQQITGFKQAGTPHLPGTSLEGEQVPELSNYIDMS